MENQTCKVWRVEANSSGTFLAAIELDSSITSFDQLHDQLPRGAYTALRTYSGTKILHLEAHLARLQETARLVGSQAVLEIQSVREAIRQVLHQKSEEYDLRIRMVWDLEETPGDLYIAALPLSSPPPEAYEGGVSVVVSSLQRELPRAKLTHFSARADHVRQSLPSGVEEALMVDLDGRISEGLSSNFFAVKNGILWTAEKGVLPGTTSELVLEFITRAGMNLYLEGVEVKELSNLEEAFLTSISRGILPVRQVEELQIGDGRPGEITKHLMADYWEFIAEELEEL